MESTGPVLVGYDGSPQAKAAVDWAAREAMSRHVELQVVGAVLPPTSGSSFGIGAFVSPDAMDDMIERAQSQLADLADLVRVERPGLAVGTAVLVGSPAGVLIEQSEAASLTVVGSRGLGGFKGLLLGSVGTQVATHAHSPVVVVRAEARPDADVVVVGVDGSPLAGRALDFAFDIASRRGWSLHAVHAWEVPSYDVLAGPAGAPPLSLDDLLENEARVAAEAIAGHRDRYPDVAVQEIVTKGPSVRVLLDAADGAALIVVGSHGRGEFLGALLGSVGQGVLHRAHVPVAVVGGRP